MYKTQQIRLTDAINDETNNFLILLCEQASKLSNEVVYSIRQKHFETCQRVEFFDKDGFYRSGFKLKKISVDSYASLCKEFAASQHYQILGGQQAQQTIKSVIESFRSYNELLPLFFNGELKARPRIPGYRKDGLTVVTFPVQAVKLDIETGMCRLAISRELSKDKDILSDVWIPGGYGFKPHQLVEVRILPRNRELYAEYVYKSGNEGVSCLLGLDYEQALGIDPGTNNWLTCVSTLGKSLIIDGRQLKSLNTNYNRKVKKIKTGKPQGFWSEELASLAELRNCQMRDAINKTARFIVNYCLNHKIGNVVFGWGQGVKDKITLGRRNNQNFVQIPTSKLKERIRQLCEEIGIQFTETEESYTSKTSFLDGDFLPKFNGEKPGSWKPSGKRVKRGMYKTKNNLVINADCNGAANILVKVKTQLGLCLAKVIREVFTLPKRYNVFSSLKKIYRKRSEAGLLACFATSV
ncbi:transposase [Kalymmatonema gypsitolerans NIES-4073]|nr:transposase [Scytonema sp. NIES-4073]